MTIDSIADDAINLFLEYLEHAGENTLDDDAVEFAKARALNEVTEGTCGVRLVEDEPAGQEASPAAQRDMLFDRACAAALTAIAAIPDPVSCLVRLTDRVVDARINATGRELFRKDIEDVLALTQTLNRALAEVLDTWPPQGAAQAWSLVGDGTVLAPAGHDCDHQGGLDYFCEICTPRMAGAIRERLSVLCRRHSKPWPVTWTVS